MTAARHPSNANRAALLLALVGLAFLVAAWALPVHLTTVTPAILRQAGQSTPSVADLARDLLAAEKPGPAALVVATAAELDSSDAPAVRATLDAFAADHPELAPWGGWDPFLDPLVRQAAAAAPPVTTSTPVLNFFVTATARDTLRGFLGNSRSSAVRTFLQLRYLASAGRFTPANQPGGPTPAALLLLLALLLLGYHPHPALHRQLRSLTHLARGRRLDWIPLATLLSLTPDTATLAGLAEHARARPDDLPLLVTTALLDDSAAPLIAYLRLHGDSGRDDLRLALAHGRGAVRLLLKRQLPVNRHPAPAPPTFVVFGLLHPAAALGCKYLGWFLGAFLLLRALDRATLGPERH